jgi:hypothetical protein
MDSRLKVTLSTSKLKAYLNSRPPGDGTVALFELVACADSRPPGFYTADMSELIVELSKLKECLDGVPDGDETIEFKLPASCYVPPLEGRKVAESNLAVFFRQVTFTGDRKKFSEFTRQNRRAVEEAGISALLNLLTHSVAKDPDYDEFTRNMLLLFLDDQLPAKLMVRLPQGPVPMVPDRAIKTVMEEWLAGGGDLESAYARVKERLGVSRTIAQRVAKKYNLRPATETG